MPFTPNKKTLLFSLLLFVTVILNACSDGDETPPANTGANTDTSTDPNTGDNTPPVSEPPPTTPPPAVLSSITPGQDWLYFKGTQSPGNDWNTATYDDSRWLTGPSGFGYGDGDDATVLSDMRNTYLSLYTRKSFTYNNGSTLTSMTLSVDYDDAYVAYLNGVEVARSTNLPAGNIEFNTAASNTREAGVAVNIDLMSFASLLLEGNNVIAIEVHNQSLNSSDLSLIAGLYFNEAAPGGNPGNGSGGNAGGGGTDSLSGYTVVGSLNTIDFIGNDLSGITYVPNTNRYFMIQNNGGRVWETDENFNLIRTLQMRNMGDTEDIVYMGNNEFAIVSEASRLFIMTILPTTTTLDASDTDLVQTIIFDSYSGNAGPEGVAFNPATQTFYIVKEQSPRKLFSFPRPAPGNQTITPDIPFDAQVVLSMANDLSAITYDPRNGGSLLILSHLSHLVVDVDISGTILGVLNLADNTQHEGITLDDQFNLQITSEANLQRTYGIAPEPMM